MASLSFSPSNLSEIIRDKNPNTKLSNFTRIPSWVSLNPRSPSIKTQENQRGQIENIHLVSLSKQGKFKEAHEFLNAMDSAGISVNSYSYESLLEACRKANSLSDGRLLHNQMKRSMENLSGSLGDSLLRLYVDCESLADAQKLFDEMPTKSLTSWGIMVSGYAQNGLFNEAFGVFFEMKMAGIEPNLSIYTSLIRLVSSPSGLELGKQLHSHVVRIGLSTGFVIENSVTKMYIKCGSLDSSMLVFDRMEVKGVESWTELLVGYTRAEKQEEALALFRRMIYEGVHLDQFVFSIVLKACSELESLYTGRQIHGYIVKLGMESDVSVGTPLVDFYVKCGSLEEARRAFERISDPNEVSWSAIISGYSQTGKFEESLRMFKYLSSRGMVLNSFIYTSLFQSCSALADLNMGSQLHGNAIKRGLVSDLYGESALVTMYSRSGSLDYAIRAFDSIDKPDIVAWTAIIAGCAYHGHALEALGFFRKMKNSGLRPNSVTFVCLLTACSHSGLVLEARDYLDSMNRDYGVEPTVDHYNCMVDIYSRAGRLEEAYKLIKTMPFEPDKMTWKILLGGCRTHRNLELGKMAGENLLRLDPKDTAAHVLLFNLYASNGRWKEAAFVRKEMVERDVRKEVSCSWIKIKDKVHRFIVGDRHHPQTEDIYSKLGELSHSAGYVECALHENDPFHEERNEQLLEHSEKLAIAFGLISTPTNAPILVFQNLRICGNCHNFMKLVSKITGREIVIRDSCRFHHLKCGECSCKDYW
ncbi:pentatricopeptide repeat (PPR) superfamily protein [Tasmannia lanceolata]|uniref:pentatricopeptide repeat (PPR) superfamily protein n=1 Tax=Tasmannia lanceolata TaxID=3420 RepID=UPI004063FC24